MRVAIARSTSAGSVQKSRASMREEADPAPVGERAVGVGDRRDLGPLGGGVVPLEQVGDDVADACGVAIVEVGADLERERGPRAGGRRGGGDRGSDGAAPRNYCPPAMRDALTGKVAIDHRSEPGHRCGDRPALRGGGRAGRDRGPQPRAGLGRAPQGFARRGRGRDHRRRRDRAPDRGRSLRSGVRPRRARRAGSRPSSARSTCSSTTRPPASTSRSTRPRSGGCGSRTR